LRGFVQGVGFRWFTRQQAQLLGCTGYVRNDPRGDRVEVVAEGSKDVLEDLMRRLRQGPPGTQVTHGETELQESTGEFGHFQVRR